MARRRPREQTIFFPWERRGGLVRLHWVRARPLLAGLGMVLLLDHESRCPPSLAELKSLSYLRTEPVDAWGRALQLTCPGRRDPAGYDLVSFGPSGDLKGLDRVE
jgi:general secretion pathway protein G